MKYSEQEIEEELFNNFSNLLLLPETSRAARQVKLGNYGIADIIIWDFEALVLWVVEVKREACTTKCIGQCARYMRGILNNTEEIFGPEGDLWDVEGIVAAKGHHGDAAFLLEHTESIRLWNYTVTMAGGLEGEFEPNTGWKQGDDIIGEELGGLIKLTVEPKKHDTEEKECPRDE